MKHEAVVSHAKYLFKGLSGFPIPEVIHAENIETYNPNQMHLTTTPTLFILTPGQIRPRSGSEAERRLRRESEGFGPSFVDYLANLNDLIVFLDEGHRYGQDTQTARAWARAISDLNPKLVIEMTATPTNPDTVLYRYDLKEALREGKYIKNVAAIVEQRQAALADEEWDKHTLLEGFRRLQAKKSEIAVFHMNYPDTIPVKPILLIAAQDTTHAAWVEQWFLSDEFLDEINQKIFSSSPLQEKISTEKVLRVDITQSEEEITKLLNVEKPENEIEIVINVGMLKEGWDVTNVYVIVPLRAMASVTLATQTIGRGLRLPYGHRVGEEEVDTLDVLAFGRETVHEVIAQAKAVGISIKTGNSNGGNMTFHAVAPTKNLKITLPSISMRVVNPPNMSGWIPQRHVEIDLTQSATITRVEAESGDYATLGEAITIDVSNPPKRLAHLLCKEISEITGQEDEVSTIFKKYFENADCLSVEQQQKALQLKGRDIYHDVKDQIEKFIQNLETDYEHEEHEFDEFTFGQVTHSVPVEIPVINKNAVVWPRDKQRAITGWQRSIYPDNKFNTPDELKVADILDKTEKIAWVRNPVHQLGIQTQAGWHYPDFVIRSEDSLILLEVKNRSELNNVHSEAYLKGKSATDWCVLASSVSKISFEYWAIPHDVVTECASIADLKSKRFIF